ncbi:hypothetical protein Salat_0666700 [Sesamum alatum]|uniref:Uncharacterized protein n=1 Tax=Sesamum alatum TaxID=300844 RepID=A0AAE2CUG0_9LAMI|nr:hypothetical protein Salat_0666700 [Sesamum alatum]
MGFAVSDSKLFGDAGASALCGVSYRGLLQQDWGSLLTDRPTRGTRENSSGQAKCVDSRRVRRPNQTEGGEVSWTSWGQEIDRGDEVGNKGRRTGAEDADDGLEQDTQFRALSPRVQSPPSPSVELPSSSNSGLGVSPNFPMIGPNTQAYL